MNRHLWPLRPDAHVDSLSTIAVLWERDRVLQSTINVWVLVGLWRNIIVRVSLDESAATIEDFSAHREIA